MEVYSPIAVKNLDLAVVLRFGKEKDKSNGANI